VTDRLKEGILETAIEQGWSMEQLQFAEDYINALRDDPRAKRPIELKPKMAQLIRDRMK
jgi:hypothetical protein